MSKALPTIKLIFLTSKKNEQSLLRLLSRMSEDISILNSYAWLKRRITDPKDIIVLVLPESDIPVDKIINAMLLTPLSHYPVIFSPPINRIMSQCQNRHYSNCSSYFVRVCY